MKFRLDSKTLAGLLMMIALLLIGGMLTIAYTYRLHNVINRMLADNVASFKAAQEVEIALFRMRGLTFNYLIEGDERWIDALEAMKTEYKTWLEEADESVHSDEERLIVHDISLLFTAYDTDLRSAIVLKGQGKTQEANEKLLHASRDLFDTIYDQCEAFLSAKENEMYAGEERIDRTNRIIRLAMYGMAVSGVLIGGFLGLLISHKIVNPMYELVLRVRDAAGGQFIERLDIEPGTEVDALNLHVHELIGRINFTTAALEKNRQLLARADKLAAIGKVAAGVAHEIRNPLTAIKMLIFSLHDDLARDDERRNDLTVIISEIGRIEKFVQNFLEFARPPKPDLREIDINETIRETLLLLGPRLQQSQIAVVEKLQPEIGSVRADADQLKQVVMNLILNASESMADGGTLTVATRRTGHDSARDQQGWVQIRISDSGTGIPHKLRDTLFDPFVSGHEEGIGLGLSISYQIIQRHGGWIEASNNEDRGATFIVFLPA